MTALMVPIALCLILNIASIAATKSCRQAQECIGETITENLEAFGYKAVFNGSIQDADVIACYGSYSCASMSSVETQGQIGCRGSHSCADVGSEIIEHNGDTHSGIDCSGQYGCENNKITSGTGIFCRADSACKATNLAAPIINGAGAYSMYGSTIDTANIAGDVLDVHLTGYQAGFGGNIICRTGDICNIYCYSSSCQMLNVECEGGNNCNIILNTPGDPTVTIPPIQDSNHFEAGLADIKYGNYPNTEQLCANSNFVYDTAWQFANGVPTDIESDGGPICCRGNHACANYGSSKVENIRYTNTPDFTVCSGQEACFKTVITTSKSIFCEGYYACGHSTIDMTATDPLTSNVYCAANWGCGNGQILGATNVYCSGQYSCRGTTIRSNGNSLNVYLLGYSSGRQLNIYCDVGDECLIFCGGAESCRGNAWRTALTCDNNCEVYCSDQDTGCPNGAYEIGVVTPAAVDCVEGVWSNGACSQVCGEGTLTRTRTGDTPAENGGAECSNPIESGIPCNEHDCCPAGIGTFDWDVMSGGEDTAMIPDMKVVEFEVYADDLTLHINVELEYLGKTSANHQRQALFGTTYVLDFDDFDAHSDNIRQPSTCQNRKESSFFEGQAFADLWGYSTEPQNVGGIGTDSTLAYPGSDWSLAMKEGTDCDTVVYERTFTWQDLRECSSYGSDGTDGERLNSVVKVGNDLKLSGIFYINVVSPFWFDSDFGYYRVYQLLSQPFVITVSSSVSVLGSTGIDLFTMWVIAVYKQNEGNGGELAQDFRLVLMTESAEYLKLTKDDFFEFTKAVSNTNDGTVFDVSETAETGADCLGNRDYICTQLWNIDAVQQGCTVSTEGVPGIGTDFSGTYSLGFTPQCKAGSDNAHCESFLDSHYDLTNGLVLSADLQWKDEICDPKTWDLQFIAEMRFYTEDTFGADVKTESSDLFQAGVDTIYVEIDTSFPDNTLTVFDTVLTNVWICSFPPGTAVVTFADVIADETDTVTLDQMGCFSSAKDTSLFDVVYAIFPVPGTDIVGFQSYTEAERDIIQFSFLIPEEVTRDTLYIHAQIEVELIEGPDTTTSRRRVLLGIGTANQISHFANEVGITHESHDRPRNGPTPNNPVRVRFNYLALKESWVIAIACVVALILALNVAFMCYANRNCLFKRQGRGGVYESVKVMDSEFDSEAQMLDHNQ